MTAGYEQQHWAMQKWTNGRDGRVRNGDGRGRELLASPWDDYIGSLKLTPSGSPTPANPGFTGWSATNYATGPLDPGLSGVYTLGIKLAMPAAPTSDTYLIGWGPQGYGHRLYFGTGALRWREENAANAYVGGGSVAMSGWVGIDVWAFIQTAGTFTTKGIYVLEAGTRNSRQGASVTANASVAQGLPHVVGRDLLLGSAWEGAIYKLFAWESNLTLSQMEDVSDGTSLHGPVTEYFR